MFQFWLKIFAAGFVMGVVSGLVMPHQFGTNWSVLSDRAGPVIGPATGYEALTTFFLDAGFLDATLFGMRVGRTLHFLAVCMAAGGTQTPAGFSIGPDGRFLLEDWWA